MTAAAAPPAESPAMKTRRGSIGWLCITWRVIPAISAGALSRPARAKSPELAPEPAPASPPLVVAYALAGRVDVSASITLEKRPVSSSFSRYAGTAPGESATPVIST